MYPQSHSETEHIHSNSPLLRILHKEEEQNEINPDDVIEPSGRWNSTLTVGQKRDVKVIYY